MAKYPKIVKLMAEAGFWLVLVGVEATNDKGLKAVAKGCNINQIKRGINVLHENEITIMGNVIIGANLNDTIEDVLTTIKRTSELSLDLPSFTLLTPFPATKFYDEIKENNLFLTEKYSEFNWLNPVIKTPNLSPEILKKLLYLGFYSIGYYAGDMRNKVYLYSRAFKSRGIFYVINPLRVYRAVISYFKWKKIVLRNLEGLKNKIIRQIKRGNTDSIQILKNAIENSVL